MPYIIGDYLWLILVLGDSLKKTPLNMTEMITDSTTRALILNIGVRIVPTTDCTLLRVAVYVVLDLLKKNI